MFVEISITCAKSELSVGSQEEEDILIYEFNIESFEIKILIFNVLNI